MKRYLICLIGLTVLPPVWSVHAGTNLVGTVAPSPIVMSLSGQHQMLSKLYYQGPERPRMRRANVVLNFMQLECAPCKKELPIFLKVLRSAVTADPQTETPLKFYLVSQDLLSAKLKLLQYIEEQKINPETELLLDPYHKTAQMFGVNATPRTIVISSYGRIVADISGGESNYEECLRNGIKDAVNDKGMAK